MSASAAEHARPRARREDADLADLLLRALGGAEAKLVSDDRGDRTERSALSRADLKAHLAGRRRVGAIPFLDGERVRWGCTDLDVTKWGMEPDDPEALEIVAAIVETLATLGLRAVPERSKGKGWHVWILFDRPVPARDVRALLRRVALEAGARDESDLVCPRSDTRTDAGNGTWLPLFGGDTPPRTRFYVAEPDYGDWIPAEDQTAVLRSVLEEPSPASAVPPAPAETGNGHTEERAEYEQRAWDGSLPERVGAMLEADGELRRRFDRHPAPERDGRTPDTSNSGIDASLACMLAHPSRGLEGWEIEHALLASHAKAGLDDPKYDSRYFARCVGFALERAKEYASEEVKREEVDDPASDVSDVANARRLADTHGADLRWTKGIGWLAWNGRKWEPSEEAALERASRIGRLVQREAAEASAEASRAESQAERERHEERAERLFKWVRDSERQTRIRAALDLARPMLALPHEELDARPWLLNCANGTLDLRTGALREAHRDDFLTRMTPVRYEPGARSAEWERVLERALPDRAVRDWLQRGAGYTAHGDTGEDVLLLLYGITRTAKGTIQGAIAAALGEYAQTAGLEDLAERDKKDGRAPRPELARLRGARMVSIYETGRAMRLDHELVKTLAGSDPITARTLYQRPITFKPELTVWLATNHRPRVDADDDALWERLREVPFEVQIPEDERDRTLRGRLADPDGAGPAVLAWIVQGALRWQAEGLAAPEAVRGATRAYRAESDRVAEWIAASCVLRADAWAPAGELRRCYEDWCKSEGDSPLGGKRWREALRRHGVEPERRNRGRGWRGIGLLPAGGMTP